MLWLDAQRRTPAVSWQSPRRNAAGALEGLPLTFIVVLVVVALVVLAIFGYWASGDGSRTESDLRAALEGLAARVEDVADPMYSGPSSYTLKLKDGLFTKIDYVTIGGSLEAPGAEDFWFQYRLSDGKDGFVVSEVRVFSGTSGLHLSPGTYDLHLEPDWNSAIGTYVNITRE